MSEFSLSHAQADMRAGYLGGAPGIAASSVAWLAASGIAFSVSMSALLGGLVELVFAVAVLVPSRRESL